MRHTMRVEIPGEVAELWVDRLLRCHPSDLTGWIAMRFLGATVEYRANHSPSLAVMRSVDQPCMLYILLEQLATSSQQAGVCTRADVGETTHIPRLLRDGRPVADCVRVSQDQQGQTQGSQKPTRFRVGGSEEMPNVAQRLACKTSEMEPVICGGNARWSICMTLRLLSHEHLLRLQVSQVSREPAVAYGSYRSKGV
jgi:hypothetical protein